MISILECIRSKTLLLKNLTRTRDTAKRHFDSVAVSPSFSLLIKRTLYAFSWRGWNSEFVESAFEKSIFLIESSECVIHIRIHVEYIFFFCVTIPAVETKYH
jgi:hypothetical protein